MIIINPGTEDLPEATEVNAKIALGLFISDLRERGVEVGWNGTTVSEDGGRWLAVLVHADHTHDVEMPGIAPEVTRRGEPWVSPRLYVDGSSWLWQYGLRGWDECGQDDD